MCAVLFKQHFYFKSGLHISRKDRKQMVANQFSKLFRISRLHTVVMIAGIHISQKIFAIDVLIALKSSFFEQRRKPHVLRLLRLYGDQFLSRGYACNISTRLSLLVPLAEHHLSSFKCCFLTIFCAKTCCVVCHAYSFCYGGTNMTRKNV